MKTVVREARSYWEGNISDGIGSIDLGVDAASGRFCVDSRFGDGEGVDPERLLAGAQAGCYAMALATQLAEDGYTPSEIEVTTRVFLDRRHGEAVIPTVEVDAEAHVDNLDRDLFEKLANAALKHCPIVNLFAGAEIVLTARNRANRP